MDDDDAWIEDLENSPIFIASQLRAGHVLTEADSAAIQSLCSELDAKEGKEVEAFHQGRENALREIGGEDLVTSVKLKDDERIAHHVRKAMDKIFPKHQRTRQ
ncbi:hypothetical protein G6L14_10790 [Agrobacterium vitis]|uniref:hypothetical protein n=1 Tax=Agrobacterium vitis TaxID=373 RepID=UPI0015738D18|nr:hypothetical protein [Agrobacterium vitis]NSY12501.1 hypothetical protein [Agrobacterium vitis]